MTKTIKEMIYTEYECEKCLKIFFKPSLSSPLICCPYCKSEQIIIIGTKNYEKSENPNRISDKDILTIYQLLKKLEKNIIQIRYGHYDYDKKGLKLLIKEFDYLTIYMR